MLGDRRPTTFAVERSETEGLALCRFIALFANQIVPAGVNYPLVGSDFVKSHASTPTKLLVFRKDCRLQKNTRRFLAMFCLLSQQKLKECPSQDEQ